MAQHGMPEHRGWQADPPSEVRVTVLPGPRGDSTRARASRIRVVPNRRVLAGLVVVCAGLAAILGGLLAGGTGPPGAVRAAGPGTAGPAGVAAAYKYPLACLTVTLAVSDPAYASARLDRVSPCWRYGAYGTAIFRRIGGSWRLMLDAPSYQCPVASLPAAVQAELAICPLTVPRLAVRRGRLQVRAPVKANPS